MSDCLLKSSVVLHGSMRLTRMGMRSSENHLAEVWTVISWCQPGRLGIWNGADLSWNSAMDDTLLSCNDTYLESLILRSFKNLVAVKAEKGFSGILSS